MPFPGTPRSSFGHVVDNGRVYIFGGHVGRYHHYPKENFSAECWSTDVATGNDVRQHASLSTGRQGHRLAIRNGEIYSFGGFVYDSQLDFGPDPKSFEWYARSDDAVLCYAPAEDKWRTAALLPRRRSSHVAALVEDSVYLIGGWDGTPEYRDDYTGRLHSCCEQFSFAKGACTPTDLALPTPARRAFTGCLYRGQIYVAGGLGLISDQYPEGEQFDEFSAFDPKTNTWRSSYYGQLPRLPKRLFSPGMGVVGDTLVLVGGSETNHQSSTDVWLWNAGSPEWRKNRTSLPAGVTFPEVTDAGSRRALVFGGHGASLPAALWEYLPIDE